MGGMCFQRYYAKTQQALQLQFTDVENMGMSQASIICKSFSVFCCFSAVMISPVITDDSDTDEGAEAQSH